MLQLGCSVVHEAVELSDPTVTKESQGSLDVLAKLASGAGESLALAL